MPRTSDIEIKLYDLTGKRLEISSGQLLSYLISPAGLNFVAAAFALMVLADPPNLHVHLPFFSALLIWGNAFAIYFCSFFIALNGLALLQKRGWVKRTWTPLISLATITPVICASELAVKFAAGPEYDIVLLQKIITYYLIAQILESIFLMFILPTLEGAADDATTEATFHVGERCIPVRNLRYLEAREHYVRVVLDSEEFMQRSRLGDIVSQLNDTEGVQPHRSWWVSRDAKPCFAKRGTRTVITLTDGTEVPVARGRLQEVAKWISECEGKEAFDPVRSAAE